jgi:mannose-6-phosphate isomerase-like protein (cupin superfamily)
MPKTLKRPAARRKAAPVAAAPPAYEFATFSEIPPFPCPCGQSRRAFRRPDNDVCSVHVVDISKDSRTHYHKAQTETYYFLEGEGKVELDGKLFPVKPGMALMIRPGTRHRAIPGEGPLKILNIVVPPFDPHDEWFD